MNLTREFLDGLWTPLRALGILIASPRLLILSSIPIFLTVVILSLLLYFLVTGTWTWVSSTFTGFFADYQSLIGWVMAALTALFVFYISIQSMTLLASLLSSPLNDLIAEETEKSLGAQGLPGWSFKRMIRIFFLDLRKTIVAGLGTLLFGLIFLIPGIGIIAIFGIALIQTFTHITYPQSRREQGVRQSLRWIREHWAASLGFGLTTTFLFSIPVIQLFVLPVAVVGGTVLYFQQERKKPPPKTG